MSKLSKTARASLGQRGHRGTKPVCPECGKELTATKVVRVPGHRGGMFWVCESGDFRTPVRS